MGKGPPCINVRQQNGGDKGSVPVYSYFKHLCIYSNSDHFNTAFIQLHV